MRNKMQLSLGPMEGQPLATPSTRARDGVVEASPTDPNRLGDWRALVGKSLGRAGLSQKVAASDLGITESALSKQLAGLEHLSFWRMASLPPAFWQELILQVIEFHGLTLGTSSRDQDDMQLGRLIREVVQRCR